jgi:replication factor A1
MANKKFTTIKTDFCLTFDNRASIEEAKEDNRIGRQGFTVTKIKDIEQLFQQQNIDVMGVIIDAANISNVTLKDGTQKPKRDFTIADDTRCSIAVSVWGENAHLEELKSGNLVVFKNCRISDYKGKSLNSSYSSDDYLVNV